MAGTVDTNWLNAQLAEIRRCETVDGLNAASCSRLPTKWRRLPTTRHSRTPIIAAKKAKRRKKEGSECQELKVLTRTRLNG